MEPCISFDEIVHFVIHYLKIFALNQPLFQLPTGVHEILIHRDRHVPLVVFPARVLHPLLQVLGRDDEVLRLLRCREPRLLVHEMLFEAFVLSLERLSFVRV